MMPIAITEVLFRSAVILWLILIFSILSTFHTGMKKKSLMFFMKDLTNITVDSAGF